MDARDADRSARERANALYWSSDLSVNQIAEELDVSKGMLYGLIHPLPAAQMCPECGQELLFANRTARDRGVVSCASCGWEGSPEDAEDGGGDVHLEPPEPSGEGESTPLSPRSRVMLGGALLGAAAGLALVFWSRRR